MPKEFRFTWPAHLEIKQYYFQERFSVQAAVDDNAATTGFYDAEQGQPGKATVANANQRPIVSLLVFETNALSGV